MFNILSLISKKGGFTFMVLALVSVFLGVIGYSELSNSSLLSFKSMLDAFALSFGDLPDNYNNLIFLSKIFWITSFASAAITVILKDWLYNRLLKHTIKNRYTAILGNYMNNLQVDINRTLILNNNKDIFTEPLKENGYKIKDLSNNEMINEINITNMDKCLVNTGIDKENINLAFKIINLYKEKNCTHPLRLIIRIEDNELKYLFMNNYLIKSIHHFEIKTYSFYESCANFLFREQPIFTINDELFSTDNDYSIILSGDGKLINKIVYELCLIAHLPNQNKLNIIIVASKPNEIINSINISYPNIKEIPTINIIPYTLDFKTVEYYKDSIWHNSKLKKSYICYDEEEINIDIVSSLQSITYLGKEGIPDVLYGIYNQSSLYNALKDDNDIFSKYTPFGNIENIFCADNLFDDAHESIAKLIHSTYSVISKDKGKIIYQPNALFKLEEDMDKEWYSFKSDHIRAAIEQSKYIPMVLSILGLKYEKVSDDVIFNLLPHNRRVFDSKLDVKFNGSYTFPLNFDNKLFDKLIRTEHNRWCAFYLLNGWSYSETRNIIKKTHDLLLPIEKIKELPSHYQERLIPLIIDWNIYAFMYIPNYLAGTGYKIS